MWILCWFGVYLILICNDILWFMLILLVLYWFVFIPCLFMLASADFAHICADSCRFYDVSVVFVCGLCVDSVVIPNDVCWFMHILWILCWFVFMLCGFMLVSVDFNLICVDSYWFHVDSYWISADVFFCVDLMFFWGVVIVFVDWCWFSRFHDDLCWCCVDLCLFMQVSVWSGWTYVDCMLSYVDFM